MSSWNEMYTRKMQKKQMKMQVAAQKKAMDQKAHYGESTKKKKDSYYGGVYMGRHSSQHLREKERFFWKIGWGIISVVCALGFWSIYMAASGKW